ncbi:MAG: C39 family peptidase [Candidatus Yanofskybacteria bacterium]|nr:C39 family peptidase [Candidatus Yanofskybacteria bacterium]
MTKDILINLPLVNQKTDTEDKKWADNTCGVCAVKMLLGYFNPKYAKLKIMDLVREGVKKDGYDKRTGWRHDALAALAGGYGLKMDYQRKFLKKPAERKTGLAFIEKNIKNKKPVIASVYYNFNPRNGGHLVVVRGVRMARSPAKRASGRVLGYHIQDPHPFRHFGHNYFVTKKEFLAGWRGGMLWINDLSRFVFN